MQIKLNTDYAIRILAYLAQKKAVIPSTELAKILGIPQSLVPSVGRKLKAKGFIDIIIGFNGGFELIKKPDDITVFDVIDAMESIKLNRCLINAKYCSRDATSYCAVHQFFRNLQDVVEDELKAKTLADLLRGDAEMAGFDREKILLNISGGIIS